MSANSKCRQILSSGVWFTANNLTRSLNSNQNIFLGSHPKLFCVVKEMCAVALGYTLFHVDFTMVGRVVDCIHTSTVKSDGVKRREYTYISHLYRRRVSHTVAVNRDVVGDRYVEYMVAGMVYDCL